MNFFINYLGQLEKDKIRSIPQLYMRINFKWVKDVIINYETTIIRRKCGLFFLFWWRIWKTLNYGSKSSKVIRMINLFLKKKYETTIKKWATNWKDISNLYYRQRTNDTDYIKKTYSLPTKKTENLIEENGQKQNSWLKRNADGF